MISQIYFRLTFLYRSWLFPGLCLVSTHRDVRWCCINEICYVRHKTATKNEYQLILFLSCKIYHVSLGAFFSVFVKIYKL